LSLSEKMPIKGIARTVGCSKNTVRKALAGEAPPVYRRAPAGSSVDTVEPRIVCPSPLHAPYCMLAGANALPCAGGTPTLTCCRGSSQPQVASSSLILSSVRFQQLGCRESGAY
jgi:hypothetical protein